MKIQILTALFLLQSIFVVAQIDSLSGFDEEQMKKAAAVENLHGDDLSRYYKTVRRNYINNKYGLLNPSYTSTELKPSSVSCMDNDFESFPPVAVTFSAQLGSWTLTRAVTNSSMTICNLGPCCSFNPTESRI